jgi:digeranylgeranylglycerophospholipid reductase
MVDYDVIVVGAGPAGSKTAELLAENGASVLMLEEHEKIGLPIQCTGLNSQRILTLSEVSDKIVLNKVQEARFYSQSGSFLELSSKKPVYVIDRHKLDSEISKRARKAGAKIKTSTKFLNFERQGELLHARTSKGSYTTRMIVGADGPNSTVARSCNIKLPKDYVVGYQETMRHDFSNNKVELWFGSKITPDFFAWVVPESDKWARVGLAAKQNAAVYFENFIKKRFDQELEKKNILGGVIRYGIIKESVSDNAILVGDAACQVKPYSGGGVIYGLIGARFAVSACLEALRRGMYDREFLKNVYDKKWKEKLVPAIRKGILLHRCLHAIPDWLFDSAIALAKPFSSSLNNLDMDLLFD